MKTQTPVKGTGTNKKSWRDLSKTEKAVVILGPIFVLAIMGFIASAADQSGTSTTASSTTQSPTKPVQQPETTRQKVSDWFNKYGNSITTIGNDEGAISTDASSEDLSSMATDCHQLGIDVTTAQSYPAIPDAQSAADYSAGLSYLQSAAQQCEDGANNGDASEIETSAQLTTQGTAKLNATTADINALK